MMALRAADPVLVAMTRDFDDLCQVDRWSPTDRFPPLQDWYEERGHDRPARYARQLMPVTALAAYFEDRYGGTVQYEDLRECLEDYAGRGDEEG